MKARQYQTDIVKETRDHFKRGRKSVLIQLPTGGGKTFIASMILKMALERGSRCHFNCHRRELVEQSAIAFGKFDLSTGIISAGFPQQEVRPLQVCSIQSLKNRMTKTARPNLIIWDEAHRNAAKTWVDIYDYYRDAHHILLTATPQRLDGRGLDDFAEVMVKGPSVRELIDIGNLSDYKAFAPSQLSMGDIGMSMGDFKKKETQDAVDKPTITGSAINEFKRLCPNGRGIVFCITIEHSQHVAKQFNQSGIIAKHVDGETPLAERRQALIDFRAGKIQVLTNVGLFTEGLDVPALDAVIMLRPTMSLSLYLQMVGRALRTAPGKKFAYILDHVGNIARHGMPCTDREWSLKGREKRGRLDKDGGAPVKICHECFGAQPTGKKNCVYCGHEFPVQEREINEVDGELVELKRQEGIKQRKMERGRAQTLDDLIALGVERGYKNPAGWAKHVFNSRKR